MKGSLRQRGAASWELRVYAGMNPDTGKRRYRTATVVGNRADAERALARLVAEVQSDKAIGSASTVSELLEAWFAIASTSWAPTTVRETRSILRRCVHPHLGARKVADVTPAMIDALYAMLRVRGSQRGGPLAAMTGARRAQLLGLRWSDVHRDARRVLFCRGWVQGEEAAVVAPTKTKRRHSVEISANTPRDAYEHREPVLPAACRSFERMSLCGLIRPSISRAPLGLADVEYWPYIGRTRIEGVT